ncbi:CopG family transcriptional regulator [Saccharolobus solfataricus]|uniref:CopG family transcriptional regulator n=3 Tax=Saccharolobus solfataricus TaxID=2287 RepID=A0A157T3Z6_SACSO|nr:CopG family transcriptional regulator [Saccharolobus solfataricus]
MQLYKYGIVKQNKMFMYLYHILFMIHMTTLKKVDEQTFELEITGTVTISFKLEDEFIRKVDNIARNLGYANRSDFIRDAIIYYLGYLKRNGNNNNNFDTDRY